MQYDLGYYKVMFKVITNEVSLSQIDFLNKYTYYYD